MTAQEAYRVMTRDYIAPALREMGFKGSAQTYTFPSETHWGSLYFQKSALRSDAKQIRFTLHLLVVGKGDWEALRQARPGMLPEHPPSFYGSPARTWTVSHELSGLARMPTPPHHLSEISDLQH